MFWIYQRIGKNKHVTLEEDIILFKKKQIQYCDIQKITINKSFIFDIIHIKGQNWKSFLAFQDVRNPEFDKFKNQIIQRAVSAKVKHKNQTYNLSILYILFFLFSFLLFIIKPQIEQINITPDKIVQQNIHTEHYSFKVDNIQFQSELDNNNYYILCDSVRISYAELPYIPILPRQYFKEYYVDPKTDNAYIEFWTFQETKPLKNWAKFWLAHTIKPQILLSETLKGVLVENPYDYSLRIKHKNSDFYLGISFHGIISLDEILEIVKSIDYNE